MPGAESPSREGDQDRQLLAQVAQGSETAFAQLVERYQRRIYTLAFRLLSDPEEAADMTQEIFLKIYRGAKRFQGRAAVSTWVYRITLNTCLNRRSWWQRRRRERWVSLETPSNPDGPSMADVLPHHGADPEELAGRAEFQGHFQAALREIPPEFRAAVVLRDVEGMTYEEVAALLSISLGTVKSRINRGRRLLRKRLAPLLEPDGEGRAP